MERQVVAQVAGDDSSTLERRLLEHVLVRGGWPDLTPGVEEAHDVKASPSQRHRHRRIHVGIKEEAHA
jgi:hypothetical protein